MTNREYRILCAASRTRIGVTALDLFREWYAESQQPQKKVAGIFKTLRRLARQQQPPAWTTWLEEHSRPTVFIYSEVRFVLSTEGRRALEVESQRRARRPAFPRMAL